MATSGSGALALRGHVISFVDDPFYAEDAFVDIPDALVVVVDGLITAVGPYARVRGSLPEGIDVVHYADQLICAGFVDAHTHYVHTGVVDAEGSQPVDRLRRALEQERRFADPAHAAEVAGRFFDELLRNGTTTALAFCSGHAASVEAFFAESRRRGTRMIGGRVLMDRNAPRDLLDTPESAYRESKASIARWHGRGRQLYAVSPRFAPTSSPALLEAAAAAWGESRGTYLHTQVSQTVAEVSWVRSLFPERAGYLDVYDHYGLLGPRAVLAHGVHLTGRERERVAETGTAVVHCPTSDLHLGAGLFHVHDAKDLRRPIRVGLGTDVGGGASLSLFAAMDGARAVAELDNYPVDVLQALYLATLGGAQALGLEERIGSVAVGKEADLVVLDPHATPLLSYRAARAESTRELLSVLLATADDRAVAATYVAGRLASAAVPADPRSVRPPTGD